MHHFVAIFLVVAALSLSFVSFSTLAAPEALKWSPVNIPAEGKRGYWQLAEGSNVEHLAVAGDGTLYAHVAPSGTSNTLFKSSNGGYRWSPSGQVTDNIEAITVMPEDAHSVYYATASTIHKSSDGGDSFGMIAPGPGGTGSGNVTITSLTVAKAGDSRIIAVGTMDKDVGQYGGVYVADESRLFNSWTNTGIGSYDVLALAFSPGYASDRLLIAVASNETDTLVASRHADMDWGAITGNVTIKGVVSRKAAIVFPPDFSSAVENPVLFLALDTGGNGGDVYRIELDQAPENSRGIDLNVALADNLPDIDVTGVAVTGNATGYYLLAGAAASSKVYISKDSGQSWLASQKDPAGQTKTNLLAPPDFAQSRRAYAATSGSGSGFSYSVDGGVTWDQLGLIDTRLDEIVGLALSPAFERDGTLFMLTHGGEHSVWRSQNGGTTWERVFSAVQASATALNMIEFSPSYGTDGKAVFLVGRSGNQWSVWKSENGGQTFIRRPAPFPIDVMAVASNDILFAGSYDGSSNLVYSSANGGFFYSVPAAAGSQRLKSIALSPDYLKDGTVLAGNTAGRVYLSTDNGTSFEQLPVGAATAPLGGGVFVVFDPDFTRNRIVYAVTDAVATTSSKQRVYRFTIGKSSVWESIDATLPVGSVLNRPVISSGGTLYLANAMTNGGMERALSPASLNPSFETVTRGLTDNATLNGLWLSGNQLWSADTRNKLLMTYVDSAAEPATLVSPSDEASGLEINNVKLDWQTAKGVTKYEWQVDRNASFASGDNASAGETGGSSAVLPPLRMATTYYWRVRAIEPVLSPWSAKWSFTTILGGTATGPELYSPEAGLSRISRKPLFQWSVVPGAERYELMVSADISFQNPAIARDSLPATAWKSDVDLDYDTTYYWMVRGVGAGSHSSWSATGVFTTEKAPQFEEIAPPASQTPEPSPFLPQTPPATPSPLPPPPPPLPYVAQPVLPAWSIYLGITLLVAIAGLLVAILVLLVKREH
ncbi:MAG: hypothetical protein HYX84_06960 [Chloroflexi bacterium]|nr:hypothetical protein [Chloroflexota bacterium]